MEAAITDPAFLAEAVGRLDTGFGEYRYQDVTAPKILAIGATANATEKSGDSYGI